MYDPTVDRMKENFEKTQAELNRGTKEVSLFDAAVAGVVGAFTAKMLFGNRR